MAKSKFAVIHNLEGLSNEERLQYLRDASVYFGLDPDLNGLDTIWMNTEDGNGLRRLHVYARKGTTDILRDIHNISITGLTRQDGPGYASFTATGTKGTRTDIAVGAHSIEGLRGERLTAAIMTAQTRALRRLTLQFVGGGLLDVSEVSAQTTDIGVAASSGALLVGSPTVMPPPQVAPSTAPGRDITDVTKSPIREPGFDMGVQALKNMASPEAVLKAIIQEDPPNTVAQDYAADAPKKRGRPRKKRNTVVLESLGQQIEMPTGYIDSEGKITPVSVPPTANEPEQGAIGNGLASTPALAETPQSEKVSAVVAVPPPTVPVQIAEAAPSGVQTAVAPFSPEKQKEYRDRLSKYSQDILPKAGGMMPSDGIGGVTMKLKKFATIHMGTDAIKLTEEQFEDLLGFLDGYTAKNGASALVEYINKAIGVK